MQLIGDALSPFAVRVMIAARYKGIQLDTSPAAGGPRNAEHLARNPIGKVPVLIDGEVVLPESDVIIGYLEDRVPEPTLFPGDPKRRANARLIARLIDVYSTPSFGPFSRTTRRRSRSRSSASPTRSATSITFGSTASSPRATRSRSRTAR